MKNYFRSLTRRRGIVPVAPIIDDDDIEKGRIPRKASDERQRSKSQYSGRGFEVHLNGSAGGGFSRRIKNLTAALEDWLFLALLGVLVAVCSLTMDLAIEYLQSSHIFTLEYANANTFGYGNLAATYFVWTGYVVLLATSSAFFVRLISPQAIGSGIPEMKTILRGVILKEYLTLRTLLSKMIGLTLSLGSGMPIGKEGPFVHIASVVANLLSQCVHSFEGIYSNESRSFEMLAAACAVGVSSTFSAPIGGVLFSIEVTSVYFAVRNYWRGFFAATCSATLFRIFRVILNETEVTVTAYYQTQFPRDAFFPEELPIFALVGVVCGFASAAFICLQRRCILFLRRNKLSKFVFQKHWAIYPALVSLLVGSLTYPQGFGRFIGGEKRFSQAAKDFFVDCTWSLPRNETQSCESDLLNSWSREGEYGLFTSLPTFIGTYFVLTVLTSTLPIPSGIFGPSFVIGAAIGRLIGEIMANIYPEGIRGPRDIQIFPGVYAIVGSAAYTGGVTHTVSVAVIVFELTGQLLHILPVMIAVLIANAISSYLQPSIYDSAIRLKHLPYLPDIPHTSSRFHGVLVEQFMTREIHFFSNSTTYSQLQETLFNLPHLKAFPIIESQESGILIGSCSRARLLRNLNGHVGPGARHKEAQRRTRLNRKFSIDQNMEGKREKASSTGPGLVARTRSDTQIVDMDVEKGHIAGRDVGEEEEEEECEGMRFKVMPVKGASSPLKKIASLIIENHAQLSPAVKRSLTIPSLASTTSDVYSTIGGMIRTLTRLSNRLRKNAEEPFECDLTGKERAEWEKEQLVRRVDFNAIGIDPAPFQLVEQTSLFKVHSLFSLLGLNRAYVTKCGRLIGVVALHDLRLAVEKVQSGELTAKPESLLFGPPIAGEAEEQLDEEVEEDEEQRKGNGGKKSVEEEDSQNDILNPRLEVVSQLDAMCGKRERKISMEVRHQMQKASREAFKGAVNLLTKGMGVGERRTSHSSTEEAAAKREEEEGNGTLQGQEEVPSPVPIFVISSSEDELKETGMNAGAGSDEEEVEEEEREGHLDKPELNLAVARSATVMSLASSPSCLRASGGRRERNANRKVRVISPTSPLAMLEHSNSNNNTSQSFPSRDVDDGDRRENAPAS